MYSNTEPVSHHRVAKFLNRVLACLTTFGHLDLLCGLYQHSKVTANFPSAIRINGSFVGDKIVTLGCLTADIALKQNSHSALNDGLESKFLKMISKPFYFLLAKCMVKHLHTLLSGENRVDGRHF